MKQKVQKIQKPKKTRIWEADFFRGFAIIMVIWDHFMYDCMYFRYTWLDTGHEGLTALGEFGADYFDSALRLFWRPVFLFIFFFTSGLCTAFSRNNLFRGLKLGAVALGVSLVTFLLEKYFGGSFFIQFGVLHCMAVIILMYAVYSYIVEGCVRLGFLIAKKPYLDKVRKYTLAISCLALGVIFYIVDKQNNVSLQNVMQYYSVVEPKNAVTGMFFFTNDWWTADYFPLFPFISYFFLGAGCTQLLYPTRKSLLPHLDWWWHKPFTIAGKHSLLIYLATQVVVMGLLALITYIITGVFVLA